MTAPFRSLRQQSLGSRYRFFRANAAYIDGEQAAGAILLAKAEQRAEGLGLDVEFQDEVIPWSGDCEAPPIHVWGFVKHPDTGKVLASLGSIGFTSWRDPYVRVVRAELLQEALAELEG
jgi:hypothetical protein